MGWQPFPLFSTPTPVLAGLSGHVSVLRPGHCPHPPHVHDDEELLLVLGGRPELVIQGQEGLQLHPARRGTLAYYPAGLAHTIQNRAAEEASYLMFRWNAAGAPSPGPMPGGLADLSLERPPAASPSPMHILRIFEGPTGHLGLLHAHLTWLEPGGGYAPHADAHDVALVTLEGSVETLGQRVEPHAIVHCPAGSLHGMRNPGPGRAVYLVFEFHGKRP